MPPARELSSSEIREILAARDSGETVADVRERYKIGTNRLYRIWKEGGKMDTNLSLRDEENFPRPEGLSQEEDFEKESVDYILDRVSEISIDVDAIRHSVEFIQTLLQKRGEEEEEVLSFQDIANTCNGATQAANAVTSLVSTVVQWGAVLSTTAVLVYIGWQVSKKSGSQASE